MKTTNSFKREYKVDGNTIYDHFGSEVRVTTVIRMLNAAEIAKGGSAHIPMVCIELRNADTDEVVRKGYLMPFRAYCFSIQSSAARDSGQIYSTAPSPQLMRTIAEEDTYGDFCLKAMMLECISRFGGTVDMWFHSSSNDVIMWFTAMSQRFILGPDKAPKWTEKYAAITPYDFLTDDEILEPLSKLTPEKLMEKVIRGEIKLKFN